MAMEHKPYGPYEKYFKRPLDFFCVVVASIVFCWLYVIVAVMVRIKLGKPILFIQERPGKDEKIFKLYKFRTMTDAKDENGELLPDKMRLTKFGKWLRSTSLDELPEAFNILKGDMSIIGPRPQLVRDMVFMTDEQRKRHAVRPGLSGLAQVKGRNAITWEDKLEWDLKYIEKINFVNDLKLVFETIKVAIINQEGITDGENVTALDYGDALLKAGMVSQSQYDALQKYAKNIMEEHEKR